jgi:ABC-2 type transport system permease protein
MNKILLIIQREYLTRVKKKSFIIMTFLGPLLMGLLLIVPVWLAQVSDERRTIAVVDDSYLFINKIPNEENIRFEYLSSSLEEVKSLFDESPYYGILYIPTSMVNDPNSATFFTRKQASFMVSSHIQQSLQNELAKNFLSLEKINPEVLERVKLRSEVKKLNTINLTKEGKEKKGSTELSMVLGLFSAVLVYVLIFMYGTQVLRGVIEEKTNRIVEVMISSVKPFQLMMGKIIGVALVGVTQFILWIVLTSMVSGVIGSSIPGQYDSANIKQMLEKKSLNANDMENIDKAADIAEMIQAARQIDFKVMGISILFFFVGGYFLYSALFAAVGAAIDNESDAQQFMLPITIPLILAFMMAMRIIENPESPVAFWFSMIPLTSPVVMMIRIPYGVPLWELGLSAALLVIGFVFATWIAARIYKVGILMYGKKVNYKELWRWFRYSS